MNNINETNTEDTVLYDFHKETNSNSKRTRKKRKKKRYLLKLAIMLLLIVLMFLFIRSNIFDITQIDVNKNNYHTYEQILKIARVEIGENLFELSTKKMENRLMDNPYIKNAKVKRNLPNKLQIYVAERVEKICLKIDDEFIVCDDEGMVLKLQNEPPALTEIENLEIINAVPGKSLEVTNNQLLTDTLTFLKEAEKNDMYFVKISPSEIFVKAYIYDNLVCEGTYDNIHNNFERLSIAINDLHDKKINRGTLKVLANGDLPFLPDVNP